MATRVIIHIGLHKTGTSAIQEFCAQNRNQLLDQAIDYTEIGLHETGHHILSHKWPGWLDESSFSEASDSAWDRLADYARADDGKTVLISSENFCGLGNKKYFEESLSFIRDKLSEAKVEIIAYVRRQDDFAESLFKQGVRGQDFCYSIDEFIGDLPAIFDYFETFSIWAKYFGKENVSVRFFEPEHFLGGI